MAGSFHRTLRQLRNTRDLRADILSLAADLTASGDAGDGRLTVIAPVISEATVREEWNRLLPAIVPEVRERMVLAIEPTSAPPVKTLPTTASAPAFCGWIGPTTASRCFAFCWAPVWRARVRSP